jgi:uroporphyrinogen-III synthase
VSRRIALTSTADRSAELASMVTRAGLVPVVLPCIEYLPAEASVLERARHRAAICDWLVVTSSRTVTTLWPEGAMPDVAVGAVGSATAAAVRTAGGDPAVVGEAGSADLFETMAPLISGRSVFFPHAGGADRSGIGILRAIGAVVETMAVYDVEPIAPVGDAVDAVVFGSPTAVAGWFLSRRLDGLLVGAVGATTASALEELGVVPDVVPDQPSLDTLIALIAEKLGARSSA